MLHPCYGDPQYEEVAKQLRVEENYDIYGHACQRIFSPENAVPWDNNLGLMSPLWPNKYEQASERANYVPLALKNCLAAYKQAEKMPFWDGLYALPWTAFSPKSGRRLFLSRGELFVENPLLQRLP